MLRYKKNIIIIIAILVCLFILVDLYLRVFSRGYGLYGGTDRTFAPPSYFNARCLHRISVSIRVENDEYYPKPETFVCNDNFHIIHKYERFDIWKLEFSDSDYNYSFLYAPVSLSAQYSKVVWACDFGQWDKQMECYSPNTRLPFRIRKQIPLEWSYITADDVCSSILGIPPVPGCVIKEVDGKKKLFYPAKLLPLFRDIYPNIEIPQSQVIDTALAK